MSKVVKLQIPKPNIAQIILEDHESRNTFSRQLIHELIIAFSELPPDTKVVIIHGYENYFCCGGTQEELLKIYEGKQTFADLEFYRILLDCKVPTIAAMQGHALGGGLVLGCYADIIIAAEECLYSTNFMKYGFTPGMGGTYIVPKKFGQVLGNEMLLSARNYHGGELRDRSAQINVAKKNAVIPLALEIAEDLASKPLLSLQLLKAHLNAVIKNELPDFVAKELAMHDQTFHLPEVKERILNLFGK